MQQSADVSYHSVTIDLGESLQELPEHATRRDSVEAISGG